MQGNVGRGLDEIVGGTLDWRDATKGSRGDDKNKTALLVIVDEVDGPAELTRED